MVHGEGRGGDMQSCLLASAWSDKCCGLKERTLALSLTSLAGCVSREQNKSYYASTFRTGAMLKAITVNIWRHAPF